MQNNNEFKGYSLFNDVEDKELQAFNRARVMANIMEDHSVERNVNGTGLMLLMGYFQSLPEGQEREDVHAALTKILTTKKGL